MTGICLCENKKCKKKNICKRFIEGKNADKTASFAEFKNICNKDNNYKWLWEVENKVAKNN